MIKRFLIAIVLLGLIAGGLVGFNMFRDKAIQDFFANMPAQAVTVSTVTVEPASWTPVIDAIGTVSASRGVDLTVETTGIVKELNIATNQRVEEGEVLVRLDDAVQQADLTATRAQAALDKQALERALELRERGVGSAVTLQAAEAAAAASAAQVEKLEAVLQQKQLRAPFPGKLGIPRVDEGQYLTPGVAVVTLQDIDTMRADFTVPEQRLSQLSVGQKVRLTADGDDTAFAGEITGIDPKVDPSSRLVSVRAAIDNPEGRLTPGQFVRINVEMPQENDVIALPQTALVTSLYGDYVYAARPKEGEGEGDDKTLEARQVFVGVGRRSGRNVEIVSGLSAGDVVVTAGQNRLSNGTPLTIDNTLDPATGLKREAAAQ
ncbi:MAG: efflux RND transporter periplasmic adaptor subunit [Aquamicrobium sp.]|uniref:efflux RND transporter periplasmic adaptor subunit n=1 Tax=Aquamicrobium sp. TaxID=1872579 RepID=UPI00349F01DB|nr:efflux RND transporter periplasmic adaptor subunit [Aquamicrobium sp.]MCO5155300.1 efflux RND transporter periplasmic adaptor subunit [Aquamicrobium sp.]